MYKGFVADFYHEFDVTALLPAGYAAAIDHVAAAHDVEVNLVASSVTSRERAPSVVVPTRVVDGLTLAKHLPWLDALYRTTFLDLVQPYLADRHIPAVEQLYAVNLNVARGAGARYECHVDSNPLQGVLFITQHDRQSGGVLAVSRDPAARGTFSCDGQDVIIIEPRPGKLVFFDARTTPHYVTPLATPTVRISVTMNYYSSSSPEAHRPTDLTPHLFRPPR